MGMYIERHMQDAIIKRSKMKGAVVVTGSRQVGKSTLIKNIVGDIPYIHLDNLMVLQSALEEPLAFFDLNPPPLK